MSASEEPTMVDEGMVDSRIIDSRMIEDPPPAPAQRPPSQQRPPAEGPPAQRPSSEPARPALTERDRQILAFERQWWRHAGAKEQAIRDTFDLSSTRYYQILNGLLDNPAALAHDPVVVGRLRRLRSARSRSRGTGRVA
ncbi:MAG TPA: DUF3263 domain-containing protein [Micromonosporaceae bacterium]